MTNSNTKVECIQKLRDVFIKTAEDLDKITGYGTKEEILEMALKNKQACAKYCDEIFKLEKLQEEEDICTPLEE